LAPYQSLATYTEIEAASPEEREEYLSCWHYENDRHRNMDY
jgi:hypothetical protein